MDQRDDHLDHFVDRPSVGLDDDRIVSGLHRRRGASGIDLVSSLHLDTNVVEPPGCSLAFEVNGSTSRTFVNRRFQPDLEIGVRHDDCADVASDHYDSSLASNGALLFKQCRPH